MEPSHDAKFAGLLKHIDIVREQIYSWSRHEHPDKTYS